MSKNQWIEKINFKKFASPFIVQYDNDYLPDLKNMLSELVKEIEVVGASEKIVLSISDYTKRVISAIELYYQGNLIDAQLVINNMIDEFVDKAPAVSDINGSIAFSDGGDCCTEIQFFRARLSDNIIEFPADEMLHIPFNKRQIVKSERFSIPGLPCLYLGNSTYDCWVEMGSPADYRFNVAPVVLDNTQQVLNLTVTLSTLLHFTEIGYDENESEWENQIILLLKLMVLTFCTSYKVQEENRNFKSEYILSQMIMLSCKSRKLDGIIYYSKQIPNEAFASTVGVNLVLFATYSGEECYSEICEHIKIGTAFNFAMFKQLLPSQSYQDYNLRILSSPYINNVGTKDYWFPYCETQFFKFDQYLFARWRRNQEYHRKLYTFSSFDEK